jgi:hypothetical protein
MADDSQNKAGSGESESSPLSSPVALIELARLLARQAAQAHFTANEGKDDNGNEQAD